jgi:MOSC domain-containing protein YiiM
VKPYGIIHRLTRYPEKGHPGETVCEAELAAGLGMRGDFHARGGKEQLSLLSVDLRQWMDGQREPGLCFGRFKENILFDGKIPGPSGRGEPAGDSRGLILTIGKAALEIRGGAKHCHPECPLFQEGQNCRLAGQSLFARVISGGPVRVGDMIEQEET